MARRSAKSASPAGATLTRGASDTGALPAFSLPAPAFALFAALALTAALRVLAPLLPGRAWWGVDLARDIPAPAFWLPWAAFALTLAATPLSGAIAARLPAPRAWHAAVFALALAALAWSFPERAFVTGDTSLRHGAFTAAEHPETIVPQALPADLLLHHALPRAIAARTPLSAEDAGRAWGALLACAWAFAAASLSRAVAKRPAAAWAAAAAAAFTAQLALHNGYGKAIVEMNLCVLVTAGALFGVARGNRRALGVLGVAVALALLLHRSAFALLPAWVAALALAATLPADRRPAPLAWAFALAPLGALAATGARVWKTLTTFDVARHAMAASDASGAASAGRDVHFGAWLSAAFAPGALLDALQTLLLTAPLALLALAFVARRDALRRRETWAALALAAPQLALLVFVRPQQGLFRDWDVFVSAGVAVSALVAWLVAEAIEEAPGAAWLALPVMLAAAAPAVQWAAHQSDAARALERAASVLAGPPERGADVRAAGFDHLGMMFLARGDYARADDALGRSVDAAPNPRVVVQWGMCAALRNEPALARDRYLRAVELNPALTVGWKGVAASASALGDANAMSRAVEALERLAPNDPTTRDARAWLEANRPAAR